MTYIDFPICGPWEAITDFIEASGEAATVIGPRELDGVTYALVRFTDDIDTPDLPDGIVLRPETVAAVCGAFMADPIPPDEPVEP